MGRTNLFKATRKYDTIDSYDRLNCYVLLVFVVTDYSMHGLKIESQHSLSQDKRSSQTSLQKQWHDMDDLHGQIEIKVERKIQINDKIKIPFVEYLRLVWLGFVLLCGLSARM